MAKTRSKISRFAVILNRGAGTLKGLNEEQTVDQIRTAFEVGEKTVSVLVTDGPGTGNAIAEHLKNADVDAIVVGGGDGTASTSAAQLQGSKIALGVLPLGTMNLFARALGVPLSLSEALAALASATTKAVDVGIIANRVFIHQASFGLHPDLIKTREHMSYHSRLGKMFASFRAYVRTLRRPKLMRLDVQLDDEKLTIRTPAIVISNNLYGERILPYADKMDDGVLGFYICTSRSWQDLLRLTADAVLGNWSNSSFVECRSAQKIAIMSTRRRSKRLMASIDGELVPLAGRIDAHVLPRALKVLVPKKKIGKPSKKKETTPATS